MPLFTTDRVDQLFERFMKHQPNFKPDAPEADRIQAELDAEKERKEARPMIYRDERHQHTFEKEAAMRPESISRALLAALYLLTADKNQFQIIKPHWSIFNLIFITKTNFYRWPILINFIAVSLEIIY